MSDRSWQGETLVLEERPESPSLGKCRVVAEISSGGVRICEQYLSRCGDTWTWEQEHGACAVSLSFYATARLVEYFSQLPQRYPWRT